MVKAPRLAGLVGNVRPLFNLVAQPVHKNDTGSVAALGRNADAGIKRHDGDGEKRRRGRKREERRDEKDLDFNGLFDIR